MPDFQYVDTLRKQLERHYSVMSTKMQMKEKLYQLEFGDEIRTLPSIRTHIPSTASSLVDDARSQIRVDAPVVSVTPNGPSAPAEQMAQKLTRFGQAMLGQLQENYEVPLPQQTLTDMMLLGAGAVKIAYDAGRVPPMPAKGRNYGKRLRQWEAENSFIFPFYTASIDPRNLLLPPNGAFPYQYAIELQKRTVADVYDKYPLWGDPKALKLSGVQKNNPLRIVEMYEYWDKDIVELYADGELVTRKPNLRGIVPYAWCYSGLGVRRVGSRPEDAAVGILEHVISELISEAQIKTTMDAVWRFHAYPLVTTEDDEHAVADAMNAGPGSVIRHKTERPPAYMNPPAPNPSMFALLPEIQRSISQSTLASVLQGERPTGVEAGYLQSLLVGQSRLKFGPVQVSLEKFLERCLQLISHQLKVLDHTMSVYGYDEEVEEPRRITPKDLEGHVKFEVSLDGGEKSEDLGRVTALLAVAQAGYMSRRTYLKEALGYDPEEESIQLYVESVMDAAVASGYLLPEAVQQALQQEEASGLTDQIGQSRGRVNQSLANPGAREGVPRQRGLGQLGTSGQTPPLRSA